MSQPDNTLPDLPHRGRVLDARLHLLDRQLLDHNCDPVGTIDDLELSGVTVGHDISVNAPAPKVTALLSGHVLATRIFGGQPPASRLQAISWQLVARIGAVVELRSTDMPFDALWVERWLRDHIIARIPGGRHAAE
jgi:hypothetical protein